jgi:iron complex outermembrane recepter protein
MYQNQIKTKLLLSTASMVVGWAAPAVVTAQETAEGPAAAASSTQPEEKLEEVIVTGTSIRGAPPVGSNVITVGREAIEATSVQSAQQLLKLVPAISGMGSAGQGPYGSSDAGSGGDSPNIHGLGGVSSNSTLVLIDGHRIPLTGIIRNLADPNILPPNAVERVEVMPEGASSVYGSDAVAGVINFITRKHFDGFEVDAQGGEGNSYKTYSGGFVGGKTWDDASALVAYSYSYGSDLSQADRPYTLSNHLAVGGSNFGSFACSPATIQPANSTSIYTYPYTGAPVSNAQIHAPCDSSSYNDLLPEVQRNSVMLKLNKQLTDALTASVDVVYSSRTSVLDTSMGSVTATVFGPGSANASQINPFFQAPAGVTTNSETVRLDGSALFDMGGQTRSGSNTFYTSGRLEYRLGSDWLATASTLIGTDRSFADTIGGLCTSCALLALNGSVNQSGVITRPSVPGTGITVTNVPLTVANALDPFHPAGTNLTSAAVLAQMISGPTSQEANQGIQQFGLKTDGTLFVAPGGNVKLAGGLEYTAYSDRPQGTTSLNIGPIATGARFQTYHYTREVDSAFLETLLPLVGPAMNVPFVRNLGLDISGRYDHYNDFGSTTNPKFALNWQLDDSVKVRGNVARSFVAPPMSTVGSNGLSMDTNYANATAPYLTQFQVPLERYPQARLIPACATAVTVCTFNTAAVPGIVINGANPALTPQIGRSWSIGTDLTPTFVPDVTLSATYWHNELRGGVTSPIPALALNSPGFGSLLTVYPNGATPAQVAAFAGYRPQSGVLPAPVYFTYDFRNQNALNLWVEGIDAEFRYSPKLSWGSISTGVATTYKTRFDQQVGSGSPVFSVLNTTGFNSTFPSERFDLRADAGVQIARFGATAYLNYTGAYRDWSATAINPVVVSASGVPVGGGDHIGAYTTIDAHLSYTLGASSLGTQVFMDITNLFNRNPPFVNRNSATQGYGYDAFLASPIGRVITLGVRAKF